MALAASRVGLGERRGGHEHILFAQVRGDLSRADGGRGDYRFGELVEEDGRTRIFSARLRSVAGVVSCAMAAKLLREEGGVFVAAGIGGL